LSGVAFAIAFIRECVIHLVCEITRQVLCRKKYEHSLIQSGWETVVSFLSAKTKTSITVSVGKYSVISVFDRPLSLIQGKIALLCVKRVT
jgi:hypothetical protein